MILLQQGWHVGTVWWRHLYGKFLFQTFFSESHLFRHFFFGRKLKFSYIVGIVICIFVFHPIFMGGRQKVLAYVEYRAVPDVFQNFDPPPPLHPASVFSIEIDTLE
jgi:hypothetical protein